MTLLVNRNLDMKIVIIGGVAGGASAAARARRLDDRAEIVILERGEEPSFANCGLPYYVGGKIESREQLLVAPLAMLQQRHRLDVRVRNEVISIDRQAATVRVKDLRSDAEYDESYDKLIIATGAAPIRPPLPGIDHPRVLELRDLADADRMHRLTTSGAHSAVVVGGGFIGVELAENLVRRGLSVTLIELGSQILPPWDREVILPVETHLRQHGVDIRLNHSVVAFQATDSTLSVQLDSGVSIAADFAIMCVGVRPESRLAAAAGIVCGPRGGIVTNAHMQSSDPNVYAVGDVAQVQCSMTHRPTQIPLAGPANRQGRIAADHIFARPSQYRGTQGSSIIGVFDMTAAMTGLSEKQLVQHQLRYEKIYIHPADHAGYYPGAQGMTLKVMFDPDHGRILGAQAVGRSGVDKRIDVLAMAIQAQMTVFDLEEAELCYAPQYGHAKDPINMAGFVAANVIRGDQAIVHSSDPTVFAAGRRQVIDVRSEQEYTAGHIPHSQNISLETLRERLAELDPSRPIVTYCKVGQRGYLAARILQQQGYQSSNLSGGFQLWSTLYPAAESSPVP